MSTAPRASVPSPHIATLVIAASVGPLAMNVFLPSLPGMARDLETDYALVQLTVSLYLAATALLQLVIGPASDRFGRRPTMLICFMIFLVGSLAAIFAPTIEFLLAARFLQAFSAAGLVLSRAIVRDTVGPDGAASKIGYVTMGMSVVPMIGPAIGGLLDETFGWQSTFVLIFVSGCIAFAIVYFNLNETNHRRTTSMVEQFRAYPDLFRSRRFWGYSLTAAFTSGAFFAFLGGGPFVATEILNLRPAEYGLYFGLLSGGYMIGNFMSGRYSRRVGINAMMMIGSLTSMSGIILCVILFGAGLMHPLALFLPISFVGLGNGMTLPNANAGLVSVRPHLAGSASGLGGALQIGGGAALSVIAGALLSPTSGPWPLIWVMLACTLAGVAATLYVIWVAKRAGGI
jgi:MFS transporter, DHA1 family, multidrug resistance protein